MAILNEFTDFEMEGGGHINHTLFWKNLANPNKDGGLEPDDSHPLAKAINDTFGGKTNVCCSFDSHNCRLWYVPT